MKILSIFLCSALVLASCKKTINEIRPSDVFQEENAFQTVADLDKGAIGAYAAVTGENIIYVAAIMSDEVRISSENRGQGQFLHKWTQISSDGDAGRAWQNLYIVIDRANRVLAAIDRVSATTAADQAERDVIKGEMLALRAWSHFELWRWYAKMPYDPNAPGVPYMKVSTISQPARESSSSNFANIEADLTQAKALIPASYTGSNMGVSGNLGVGRITRLAVSAIQARAALYKQDWANAITYATECITAVPLAARATFPSIWTDAINSEVIWKLKRTTQLVSTLWRDVNGDIFFQPSDKLRYAYDSIADIRFATYIKVSHPGLQNDPDDTVTVNKYPGITGAAYTNDIKMFRVAEMYLIRAEAKAETSDLVGSATDVNTLRAARFSPTPAPLVFASKQAAIDAIYNERFLELAFEGHRYFDLKRRALPIQRAITDSAPEYRTLDPSNTLYLLPIPQRETLANPNMQQNPGY